MACDIAENPCCSRSSVFVLEILQDLHNFKVHTSFPFHCQHFLSVFPCMIDLPPSEIELILEWDVLSRFKRVVQTVWQMGNSMASHRFLRKWPSLWQSSSSEKIGSWYTLATPPRPWRLLVSLLAKTKFLLDLSKSKYVFIARATRSTMFGFFAFWQGAKGSHNYLPCQLTEYNILPLTNW